MIPLECGCGKSIRVKDEHAGHHVRCPACRTKLAVPYPDDPETEFSVGPKPEPWRFPDFSVSRLMLVPIAIISGFMAFGGTFGRYAGEPTPAVGMAWICFTVALAGLAASRPRR